MTHKDSGPQVEFVSLMGDQPVIFASGSLEEVSEAISEGRALDEHVAHPSTEVVSPGTYHAMGKLSCGLGPEAKTALEEYDSKIKRARQSFRESLGFSPTE